MLREFFCSGPCSRLVFAWSGLVVFVSHGVFKAWLKYALNDWYANFYDELQDLGSGDEENHMAHKRQAVWDHTVCQYAFVHKHVHRRPLPLQGPLPAKYTRACLTPTEHVALTPSASKGTKAVMPADALGKVRVYGLAWRLCASLGHWRVTRSSRWRPEKKASCQKLGVPCCASSGRQARRRWAWVASRSTRH